METKTLYIDADLHRRIKATAAMQGITIKEWIENVAEDALAGRPSSSVLVDTQAEYRAKEATE